jgi:hypothetical protein
MASVFVSPGRRPGSGGRRQTKKESPEGDPMATPKEMLETHPRRPEKDLQLVADVHERLSACMDSCLICADACLAEDMVKELVRCIRLNQDCADVCRATLGIMARMTDPDGQLLRAQLQACIEACRICGEECEKHAEMHEHCRLCADECRQCEASCSRLLATF